MSTLLLASFQAGLLACAVLLLERIAGRWLTPSIRLASLGFGPAASAPRHTGHRPLRRGPTRLVDLAARPRAVRSRTRVGSRRPRRCSSDEVRTQAQSRGKRPHRSRDDELGGTSRRSQPPRRSTPQPCRNAACAAESTFRKPAAKWPPKRPRTRYRPSLRAHSRVAHRLDTRLRDSPSRARCAPNSVCVNTSTNGTGQHQIVCKHLPMPAPASWACAAASGSASRRSALAGGLRMAARSLAHADPSA